ADGVRVGEVTSAVWSPRLEQNIALAMVSVDATEVGTELTVETYLGTKPAPVVQNRLYDPNTSLATG
ncbi:MAG: glycine cleavage T C-terminal barrel domain-containing protein, partial [Actinomycetota bacterium]